MIKGDILLIESRVPCLVSVSIHPPSITFCIREPEDRGIRDEAWALIGVVNANDVIASLILGLTFSHEELISPPRLNNHPVKSPEDMAISA